MSWPTSKRLRREYEDNVLHEGIPDWLWSGIIPWIEGQLSDTRGLRDDDLRTVERMLRRPLNWGSGTSSAWHSLVEHMRTDHDYTLDLLGLLVRLRRGGYREGEGLPELERMLKMAGSAWHVRVIDDLSGVLERRVEAEQVERLEQLSQKGRHGEHLQRAWTALYGRAPDPNVAYGEAVKAVEAAEVGLVSPDNRRATLGTMVRDFEAKPTKWNVALGQTPEQGRSALLEMMKAVWHGQHNRHGTPDETRPSSVSSAEAEAAVHTALTLVHLFTAGLVTLAE